MRWRTCQTAQLLECDGWRGEAFPGVEKTSFGGEPCASPGTLGFSWTFSRYPPCSPRPFLIAAKVLRRTLRSLQASGLPFISRFLEAWSGQQTPTSPKGLGLCLVPQLSCSLLLFPLQLLCYPPLPAPHMLVCSSCRRTFAPAAGPLHLHFAPGSFCLEWFPLPSPHSCVFSLQIWDCTIRARRSLGPPPSRVWSSPPPPGLALSRFAGPSPQQLHSGVCGCLS